MRRVTPLRRTGTHSCRAKDGSRFCSASFRSALAAPRPGHDSRATAFPRHVCARALHVVSLLEIRGRRECRAPDAPAAACVVVESTRVSHHGHTGNTRHSPRNGFTAYSALSPGTGLSCPRRRQSCLRRLDTSVGASGPHDFAVRFPRSSSCRAVSVHRIPPRVRDVRNAPLWDRTGRACRDDLPDGESGIFLWEGLDTRIERQPVGQIKSRLGK